MTYLLSDLRGLWQAMQFSTRIGATSRMKLTGLPGPRRGRLASARPRGFFGVGLRRLLCRLGGAFGSRLPASPWLGWPAALGFGLEPCRRRRPRGRETADRQGSERPGAIVESREQCGLAHRRHRLPVRGHGHGHSTFYLIGRTLTASGAGGTE